MKSKQAYKGLFGILFALLLLISAIMSGRVTLPAFAAETGYTGALEDLQKDENFNVSVYPDNESDYKNSDFAKKVDSFYSIHVIQIAESTGGELFIYTYQPCQKTRYLVATEINMSLTDKMGGEVAEDEELSPADSPKLYGLTLLSGDGVLCKYKVNDFTVSEDETRYYNITSIYREWIEGVDKGTGNDNVKNEVAFKVGKCFTAKTVDGVNFYSESYIEVIEILNPFADYIEYSNGFKFFNSHCDSHYIAFSADKKIDSLLEATVYFESQSCVRRGSDKTLGDIEKHTVELSYTDRASNPADGWFSKKYTWERIQRVDEFIQSEDLKDETKAILKDKQWVLRFYETERESTNSALVGALDKETYTIVSNVSVLRLEFETAGNLYNLGAVSDKVTGDDKPGNVNTDELDFWGWLLRTTHIPWWGWLIIGIVALAILLSILGLIIRPFGKFLIKVLTGIWWLVSAPFRGIIALVRRMKKE